MSKGVTNDAVICFTETQTIPYKNPKYTYYPGSNNAFHHGRKDIFTVYHAPVKKAKPGGIKKTNAVAINIQEISAALYFPSSKLGNVGINIPMTAAIIKMTKGM